MKVPKLKLDAAAVQEFLLQHVEKVVLSLVVLLAVYLVYTGYQTPSGTTESPKKLLETSLAVQQFVTAPSDDELKQRLTAIYEKRPVSDNVDGLVKEGGKATESAPYRLSNRWRTPDYPKLSTRSDPRVFAPLHVKVAVVTGPIASLPKQNEADPLGDPVFAAAPEEGKAPVRIPKKPPPNAGEGGILASPRGKKGPPPRGGEGALLGGPGPGQNAPGFPGQGEGMLAQPGMGANPGGVNPESILGFFPSGPAYSRDSKSVVVMAVVPYDQQLAEFEKVFESALDFDEVRDFPRYIGFVVERADVTADPAADPAQLAWTKLDMAKAIRELRTWAGYPTELIDPNYFDPLLSHPAPPYLQRDLWDILTHKELPLASVALAAPEGQSPEGNQPTAENPNDEFGPAGALPVVPGVSPAGPGRNLGEGMRPAGGPGGMNRPGFQPGIMSEGGQGPGSAGQAVIAPPKYKLVRFTDSSVEMGKKYRYRVKVALEDPNNPYMGSGIPPWDPSRAAPLRAPTAQSLSDVVKARIRDREALPKDPKSPTYQIESAYSDPSAVVFIPPPELVFAGKAEFPPIIPINIKASALPRPALLVGNTKLNLLSVVWDPQKAVDVPGEVSVARGSYVIFSKDAEVIHPVFRTPHPIGKYDFRPNMLVVDVAGGEGIPNSTKPADKPLNMPGEALVFDREGNLRLLNEADDIDGFRRYLPAKGTPPPAAGNPAFPGPGGEGNGFQDLLGPPAPKGRPRPGGA